MRYNIKQKQLIKKLFQNLAIITLGVKYNEVNIKIRYDKGDFINHFYHDTKIISFNYYSISYRIKQGYSNLYYEGRKKKIDKIIHNNKKNFIRFVLLHELYHYKQRYYLHITNNYPEKLREKEADDFAIDTLKNKGVKHNVYAV